MEKKDQIINAAKKLFETYGVNKISMNEIANEANVTKRTIYFHFKNKDDLIKYFLEEETNNIKKIVKNIESQNISIIEKIHNIIISLIEYKEKSKFLNKLSIDLNKQTIRAKKAKNYDNYINNILREEIKQTIKNAVDNKIIKDCDIEITSFIIYKIYFAIMFEWDKQIDKEKASKHIKNILENGLFN